MIDLGAFVALRAVDTHRTVAAAADALGFTPSAVSQQIKRLERQTGVLLLERVGRGVMLTHAGRQLVNEGARLLADLEALEAGLHRQAGAVAGIVRLTAFPTAMRGLVAPVARGLLATFPDLSLDLVEREPEDTIEHVATGQTDVGIVHGWGDLPLLIPDHVVSTVIAHDVADVIVHRDHTLARRRRVRPAAVTGEGWIATPEGTTCRQWLVAMFDGAGSPPRVSHVAMEFDSHLALVRAGLGIALIPRLGRAPLGDDLVALEVDGPVPTREIVAIHRESMAPSPAIAAVLNALRAT